MRAETTLEFFAIIGVIALVAFALYTVLCVIFAIVDHVFMHRINKDIEKASKNKKDKTEVHDGSMV